VSLVADRPASPSRRRLIAAVAGVLMLAAPAGASAVTSTTPATSPSRAVAPKPAASAPRATNTPTTTTSPPVAAKPKQVAAKPKKTPPKPKKKKAKAAVPLTGWRGSGSKFPNESLILSVPNNGQLASNQVHLSENGTPVTGFSLTPLARAGTGDFGFVVAIDQSQSVTVPELNQEMNAVRLLAPQRRAAQQLGMIMFGATPNVLLPLTSNTGKIAAVLATTPGTSPGADVPAATTLALTQLLKARDAAGAVVVISDGNGASSPTSTSRAAVASATAAHIPIFTVGLQGGGSTASSLNALKQIAPGPFVSVTVGGLAQQLGTIFSSATNGYVVRYRSAMRPGQAVTVSATVGGTQGAVTADYTVPTPPVRHVAKPVHHAPAKPSFAGSSLLSPAPTFVAPPAPPAPAATSGFWASSGSAAVIAIIAALLVVFAVMLVVKRPSQRAVRTRVGRFIAQSPDADGTDGPDAKSPSLVVRLLERGGFWPKFVADVEIAQNPRTPVQLLKRAMVIGAIVAVLLFVVTGTALYGLLVLVAAPLVLRFLVTRAARKQRALFRELLPLHLQDLAGAMRAGRTVVGALQAVAESADEPVKSEFERAIRDEQLGLPLDESLETIARRMDADDMDQVALVAALNRRSGANVAEALDRVAEGARERAEMRREVKALTGQAKMSSWVLTGLPPLLLIGISVIAPIYAHPMFHTPIGLALLGVSAVMVFSGWKVMNKIINVKV
jgi:Flp pilus assembly protein TadB